MLTHGVQMFFFAAKFPNFALREEFNASLFAKFFYAQ